MSLRTGLALEQHHFQLPAQKIAYQLIRSKRKTIGFSINTEGLTIRAPESIQLFEIEKEIQTHQRWILRKLQEWQNIACPTIHWQNEMYMPFLGKCIKVQFSTSRTHTYFDEDKQILFLCIPRETAEHYAAAAITWLKKQAKPLFYDEVTQYSEKLGVKANQIQLSQARSSWGYCTSEKNIRLSWRLIYFPKPIIEYVIAHEVAHLQEMNHSKQFWQLVAQLYPAYLSSKNYLNTPPDFIRQFVLNT